MGTRVWNCVGRCSQVHSDDEHGTDFFLDTVCTWVHMPTAQLFAQPCCSGVTPRNFGANPTASSGNGTSADDDRMQVDSLKKGKRKGKGTNQRQRGNRTTSTTNTSSADINACKNCGKPGHWRKIAGIPVEERMTIPPTEILAKTRVKTQVKGKENTWTLSKQNNFSLMKQPQPCRILRKIRALLENSRAFRAWTRGSWE